MATKEQTLARRKLALLTALALAMSPPAFPQASPRTDSDALAAARAALAETGPSIGHSPLKCLEENQHPAVRAEIQSPASLQRSRVYFKAHQYPDWYYVEMASEDLPRYLGTLPKPLPGTSRVDYYVYSMDNQLQRAQTAEYDPEVAKACRRDLGGALPGKAAQPRITLFGTKEGQPPIPPGFDGAGIVAFVTLAGATVTGAALWAGAPAGGAGAGPGTGVTGAASAGGLSAATLGLIAGGVAVAGIGVAVAGGGGGTDDPLARDDDGDGVSENAGDCNDGNPQVNPNGMVSFSNARFATAASVCSHVGSVEILVDANNNRCAPVTVTSVSSILKLEAIRNDSGCRRPGETFGSSSSFAPGSVGSGAAATVRVQVVEIIDCECGIGEIWELSGQVTLKTSAGAFTLQTTNRHSVTVQ